MCLPMKSRSAFSTICYSLSPAQSWLSHCVHGKILNARVDWVVILTDNIQHRYLMLLLITHSSWENYSDEIMWFKRRSRTESSIEIGVRWREKSSLMENCNWWWLQSLDLMPFTKPLTAANKNVDEELLENKSRAQDERGDKKWS